ncbi:hypothetical protein L596_026614 [Steinernema carpocapsae]|uniref:Uncharacterized protein n=1 Tax=Steinernema carpocapsae TaxID=34508 RepID=A0A4U5M1X9_STECR|nr:hypothetical protein L596_026614 [Steinernema carpocapsae]
MAVQRKVPTLQWSPKSTTTTVQHHLVTNKDAKEERVINKGSINVNEVENNESVSRVCLEKLEDATLLKPPIGMLLSSFECEAMKKHWRSIKQSNCSLAKNSDRRQKRRVQIPTKKLASKTAFRRFSPVTTWRSQRTETDHPIKAQEKK